MMREEIIEIARQAGLTKTVDCCGVKNKFCSQDQWKGNLSVFAKLIEDKVQARCCSIVYGMAGSDNVAQRTVDAIRGKK